MIIEKIKIHQTTVLQSFSSYSVRQFFCINKLIIFSNVENKAIIFKSNDLEYMRTAIKIKNYDN